MPTTAIVQMLIDICRTCNSACSVAGAGKRGKRTGKRKGVAVTRRPVYNPQIYFLPMEA